MSPTSMSSQAVPNGKRCWPSSSPSMKAFTKQQINTSVPLTVTPATAVTPNGASSTASPATLSIQSSPEGPRGRYLPPDFSPTPLELPETTLSTPPLQQQQQFHSAMSEAIQASKSSPGIIRRLSGAARKLRHRQSSNHIQNRDRSSGPAILRRRSNSKNGVESDATSMLDNDFEADIEDVQEDPEPVQGLGLTVDSLSRKDGTARPKPALTQGGISPIVPPMLRKGTSLIKFTKKKKKNIQFVLDPDSAKVIWDPNDPSKQFYIDDIQQIRLQSDARNYREECGVPIEYEHRWFTIIYADPNRSKGRPSKTMHLVAPNQITFTMWTTTLDDLQKYRYELMSGVAGIRLNERTLRNHWKCEMAKIFKEAEHREEDETLDLQGVENLCHSFYIHCSSKVLHSKFDEADFGGKGYLNFAEFKDFVRKLKHRDDIQDIYKSLRPIESEGLPLEDFLKFLQQTQGIDVQRSRAHWIKIFNKYIRLANKSQSIPCGADELPTDMSSTAFTEFLCSDDNNIQNFEVTEAKFDKPLNEYFISSSHNTYLLGRQVAGGSSTEAYIRALQRACRCVEIDCWDGPDGKPMVTHGHTMTTSVLFADCISVIGRYAFESSPYPLILSLEVHCKPEQQQAMVEIMIRELGEQLVTEPLVSNANRLPSPEELRNRILVKVKAGHRSDSILEPPGRRDIPNGRRDRSFSSPWSRPQILDNSTIPNAPLPSSPPSMSPSEQASAWGPGRSSMTTTSMSSGSDSEASTRRNKTLRPDRSSSKKQKLKTSKIIPSLGRLGVYTQGFTFESFTTPESKSYNHIYSMAERRFEKLCSEADLKAQLEKHNMSYLMRVYPSGFRIHSTNPDPLIFWRRGVQMMALNWQTYDLPMQLNEAMFASGSDKLGYVLKPRELRESLSMQEEITEPSILGLGKMHKQRISFSVEVISAQQLPRPRGIAPDATLDPYVEIELFSAEDKSKGIASGEGGRDASARNGMVGVGSPLRKQTHIVQANGFNPIFNEKFTLCLDTKYPSLVFVRWTVWNSPDGRTYTRNQDASPLATFTAKLSSLEQGYRHLRLYDHNGDQFNCAALFCKIKKQEPVTIEREDPIPEKTNKSLKGRFNNSAFKRTLSVENRNGKRENVNSGSSKSTINGDKSSEGI
ncbi:hypothetical protein P7C71_g1285, partial [Lecanoromycetidae sp. Uapishka_2]